MKVERLKNVPLIATLILFLLVSCYIQMNYVNSIIPEYDKFIESFSDSIKNLKLLMLIVSFMFQTLIMVATICLEVILLYLVVTFFYGKKIQLRDYARPVIVSMLFVLIINIIISSILLPTTTDIDTLKKITFLSPVNYVIKPLLVCYFLSKKDIIPNKLREWIKVGIVYVLFTCIPGFLLLLLI